MVKEIIGTETGDFGNLMGKVQVTLQHFALKSHNVFIMKLFGFAKYAFFGMNDDLGHTIVVTQINEADAAMVSDIVYPA